MKLKLNIYYRIILITSLLFSLYCFLFNDDNKNLKIIGYIIVTINLIIMAFLIQKQKRENQS
jgi:L-asparagine transporter-like permease